MKKSRSVALVLAFTLIPLLAKAVEAQDNPCSDLLVHVSKPPIYPPIALAARFSGKVSLTLQVGGDGKILNVEDIDGPALLQGAARDYVANWQLDRTQIRKHKACNEKVTIDYKFLEPAKSVSSYSYEIVTQDGLSSTVIIARPPYYPDIVEY